MRDSFASQHLLRDVPLAPLTTFRIGGPARFFRRAADAAEIVPTLQWARRQNLPLFVLGGGSNLVMADEGFDGVVLQVVPRGIAFADDGDHVIVRAAAGEIWLDVVAACLARNLAGAECLDGIPGLVGAVPIQNVGAYGQEVADTIVAVDVIDRADGTSRRFLKSECGFAYRRSRFNGADAGQFIVTSVEFRMRKNGAPSLAYPAVRDAAGPNPTLQQVAAAVVAIRRTKSMVVDDSDPYSRSAGSFFLNPTIGADELVHVRERAERNGVDVAAMPVIELTGGGRKLSSAWLIEQSGYRKGHRHGNVAVSPKHPLAIVNVGGGTAADVAGLARAIRSGVQRTFGITLHPEPVFAGFHGDPLAAEEVA